MEMNEKNYYNCWWFWFLFRIAAELNSVVIQSTHSHNKKERYGNVIGFYSIHNSCIIIRGDMQCNAFTYLESVH